MRLYTTAALVLALCSFFPASVSRNDSNDLVNPLLGDCDRVFSSENERVQTHLRAVADRLGRVDDSSLTPALREARHRNLQRLREYASAAVFPTHTPGAQGRVPNFLDHRGNVCAVGYLVEQDLGRATVVDIASEYQFEYVPYIDSPALSSWQSHSGLSLLELAMIQPSYGELPPNEPFQDVDVDDDTAFIIALTVLNFGSSIANFSYLVNENGNVTAGLLGVIAGTASFLFGLQQDSVALQAGGVMAGLFGGVGFGFGVASADDKPKPITVGATPMLDGANQLAVGVVAQVRF